MTTRKTRSNAARAARGNGAGEGAENVQPKSYPCALCDKEFSRSDTRTKHERTHTGERPFKCELCSQTFTQGQWLTRHLQNHEGTEGRRHQCSSCDATFAQKNDLAHHKQSKHSQKKKQGKKNLLRVKMFSNSSVDSTLTCKTCDKSFTRREHLHEHSLIHTGTKKHKCPECKRAFLRERELKRHSVIHTGKKRFKCRICNELFTRNVYLQNHVNRVHEGVQVGVGSWEIDSDCDSLRDESKCFLCRICGESFTRSAYLKKHAFDAHLKGSHRTFQAFKTWKKSAANRKD